MTAVLREIKSEKQEIAEDVVARAAEILERCKNGEIVAFAAVIIRPDNTFETLIPSMESSTKVIGCLAQAQHDLMSRLKE